MKREKNLQLNGKIAHYAINARVLLKSKGWNAQTHTHEKSERARKRGDEKQIHAKSVAHLLSINDVI